MAELGAWTSTLAFCELSCSFFSRDVLKYFSSSLRRFSLSKSSNGLGFCSSRSAVSGKLPATYVKGKKNWNCYNNLSMCSIIIFQFHPYFVVTMYVYFFKTQNNGRSLCAIPSVVSVPSSCISYFIDNDIKHVIVYQVVPYSLATQPINDIPRLS